jgi:hypothetical protein
MSKEGADIWYSSYIYLSICGAPDAAIIKRKLYHHSHD